MVDFDTHTSGQRRSMPDYGPATGDGPDMIASMRQCAGPAKRSRRPSTLTLHSFQDEVDQSPREDQNTILTERTPLF